MNQPKAVLVVSFGSTYPDNNQETLGAIEEYIRRQYPQAIIRRAYISLRVIEALKERHQLTVETVAQALEQLQREGVKEVIVQPTFLLYGEEYNQMCKHLSSYKESFQILKVGPPLLAESTDVLRVAEILAGEGQKCLQEDAVAVLVGHGSRDEAGNRVYQELQKAFVDKPFVVGTLIAKPGVAEVKQILANRKIKKVVLWPLMVVAGSHTKRDIFGEGSDSFASRLAAAGYELVKIEAGLGSLLEIQKLYAEHVERAKDI
ncbi:sirohydrochlorin cobaltochelatase [Ohessyouella blattaphilus]|uniref:Sirohydrochlorin cobaltochelatase n=1 Tax=Ohessyouella blattaphilus TaxID=2949333 RepID=A0ABT1EFX1_9FIRM|nr:sirohydrochlorin cobaltochelatase [Ohessyouella blattaphilus]MCP1109543.1 sirohydrochlorin cobaltochelatase [Ohessyouella blattaphilus]MCR8562937.1 sirohydrochlorin cobaltochelatase [Ohessyouella blattaphilus]